MQYRIQGNRTQVLAYRGYDKVKKRAEIKLLGSYARGTLRLSDGLLEKLTVSEKEDLQSHLATVRQVDSQSNHLWALVQLANQITGASDCLAAKGYDSKIVARIQELMTPAYAARLYAGMSALTKALRKRGHVKLPMAAAA